MRKRLWWLIGWLLISSMLLPSLVHANTARRSYFRAARLFKKKQWAEAKVAFQKTLSLVKKLPSKTKRQKMFISLGVADISYHLARIHLAQSKTADACIQLSDLLNQIDTIKKRWPRWRRQRINLLLPGRFRDAKKRFVQCEAVPAKITLADLPPNATVLLKDPNAADPKDQWKPIGATFQTKEQQVQVQVKAKGYITQTKTLKLKRWAPQSFSLPLKKKPKPRVRPRPRERRRVVVIKRRTKPKLPPPTPVYKKAWFWVVVGAGVAVVGTGVAVGVYAATQGKRITPTPPDPGNLFPSTPPP